MKVVEGLSGGVEPGSVLVASDLGLPATGERGVLLVIWKAT